jgi:hypothetical protein
MSSRRCWGVHVTIVSIGLGAMSLAAQERLSDRTLSALGREDAGFFVHANITQSHFRFIVAMIARSARVPIGLEEVAAEPQAYDGNLARVPEESRTPLIGLTVHQALDRLVAADPRYRWQERDGVILIRPIDAWNDPRHYLLRPRGVLDVKGQRPVDIVKQVYEWQGLAINWGAGGMIGDPRSVEHDVNSRISLSELAPTILDTLNAVIVRHGGLGWLIEYARGPAELANSCVRLITFDGKFIGVGPAACPARY